MEDEMSVPFGRPTMKKVMAYWAVIILVLLTVTGCTETVEPSIHADGWLDPGAENSHMARIASSGISGCEACHGGNYFGGTSEVSCYTCHAGGPSGHPDVSSWLLSPESDLFHGQVAQIEGFDHCTQCHGSDLAGGAAGGNKSCAVCHDSEQIASWIKG